MKVKEVDGREVRVGVEGERRGGGRERKKWRDEGEKERTEDTERWKKE